MIPGLNFSAIDWETARQQRNTACSVGIVVVIDGIIVEEFSTKIRPPNNSYHYMCTKVHGMTWRDTRFEKDLSHHLPSITKRIRNTKVIAHNVSFDKSVLVKSLADKNKVLSDYNVEDEWICTLKIARQLGYKKAKLNVICEELGIKLNHHDALSDARACALFYIHLKQHKLI